MKLFQKLSAQEEGDKFLKRYITNIIKPKWYIIILFALIFTWQCFAIIAMYKMYGMDYYIIGISQLITGFLNILLYLIIQKEKEHKGFKVNILISLLFSVPIANWIIKTPFLMLPGIKGIFYGNAICLFFASLLFIIINIIKRYVRIGRLTRKL